MDGVSWIISYVGVNRKIIAPIINNYGLRGGRSGTFPTVNFTLIRDYNSDLLV